MHVFIKKQLLLIDYLHFNTVIHKVIHICTNVPAYIVVFYEIILDMDNLITKSQNYPRIVYK